MTTWSKGIDPTTNWSKGTDTITDWSKGTDPDTEWFRGFLYRKGLTWKEADMFWTDIIATWQNMVHTAWDRQMDRNTAWTRS